MTPRKIMLLGDIGVGKSSIVRRLVFDEFDHNYKPTLGVDVYSCEIAPDASTDAPPAKFVIWDTDGNFGDSILSLVYIREATAALVVGDLTRPATISTMLDLGRNFMQAMPGRYCGYPAEQERHDRRSGRAAAGAGKLLDPRSAHQRQDRREHQACLSRSSRRHSPSRTLKPT